MFFALARCVTGVFIHAPHNEKLFLAFGIGILIAAINNNK